MDSEKIPQQNIRNFVIIAHIDHGKSTLADRLLEITKTVPQEKMKPQILDTMDLEKERGITIKLQPVTINYQYENIDYELNLIDTPGHEDFSYEVSRSLHSVEGALLVVDATQGIQAQTLANLHHAKENNLTVIPIINKIDMPNARIEETVEEIKTLLNIDANEILRVSAKTGEGVKEILIQIITKIPPPSGSREETAKMLIFDSVFSSFRGVIAYCRAFEGQVRPGDKIKFLHSGKTADALEVGNFGINLENAVSRPGEARLPRLIETDALRAGEIGYIVTGEKDLAQVQVGDTISENSPSQVSPISGFKIPQSVVFASIFTTLGDPILLRKSLEKLKLNDSSLNFQPENSLSFGHGFKCGFLGMLHLEIVKERLEREYNLDLIITQPQVKYETKEIGPKAEPARQASQHTGVAGGYFEPWANLEILTPSQYIGPIMELCQSKRGIYKDTNYFGDHAILIYEIPLAEIIIDFHDKLKSASSGYASQNYELTGNRPGDLVKLDVIIASDKIEEFSRIVPREKMMSEAKNLALKLKALIPRQMFEVSIQIANSGKIIARENISAMKKDVIAKLYGGDRTRKDKLLKKQAAGKKKMKMLGRVEIPDNVFIEILKS